MDGGTVANFLETYRGRDKIYRLIAYFSSFVGSGLERLGHAQSAARLQSLGSALSSCRVVLRLGDDLAMWQVTKEYGTGSQVAHPVLRLLGLIQNVFDQIYYPLEHVAWACDSGILKRPSAFWWVASVAAWAGSLLTSIVTSLLRLTHLNLAIARASTAYRVPTEHLPSSSSSSEEDDEDEDCEDSAESAQQLRDRHGGSLRHRQPEHRRPEHRSQQQQQHQQRRQLRHSPHPRSPRELLETQRRRLLLQLAQHASDLLNAIHWLPAGFLWGGKLSSLAVGFNGVVSSAIGLFLMLARYRDQYAARQAQDSLE